MSGLAINNFSVLNETTGKRLNSGRMTNAQMTVITTQDNVMSLLTEGTPVPGAPAAVTGGPMLGVGWMTLTYIKIRSSFIANPILGQICLLGPTIRIMLLEKNDVNQNSILYGFASSLDTPVSDIDFEVAIANTTSQTVGDYFDVVVPDPTAFPDLYLAIFVLNGAWDTRTVVSTNVCGISSVGSLNYCVDPTQSTSDVGQSHFVGVFGINTVSGLCTRACFGCYDKLYATEPQVYDYTSLKFSVSDAFLSDVFENDTDTVQPMCFCAGTYITCSVDGIEVQIKVEDLCEGTLIKTFEHGYLPAACVFKSAVVNRSNTHGFMQRVWDIYRLPMSPERPNQTADLYLTGGHSVLVEEMSEDQRRLCAARLGGVFKIGDKYRMLACVSDQFEEVKDNNRHTIFHLSVGMEDAVYANGVLTETCNLEYCRPLVERQRILKASRAARLEQQTKK